MTGAPPGDAGREPRRDAPPPRVSLYAWLPASLLCAVYAAILLRLVQLGAWPVLADGGLAGIDFVPLYVAGGLARAGEAAQAYDWGVLLDLQRAAGGPGTGGWLNPPTFFLVMAPLSALPYAVAFATWIAGTAAVYALGLWRAFGHPAAVPLGFAAPATLFCVWLGQSGLLAAGLLGLCLALIDRRPVLAGILLGLLTYKPHLGLLFPLLLAAGGHWRSFLAAAATTLAMAALSLLLFGAEAWLAFLFSIGTTGDIYFGGAEPACSVHGAVLHGTGSQALAVALHAAAALAAAAAALSLWRRGAGGPAEARAAAAIAAGLLVTPYAFVADAALLAMAAAFLARAGLRDGFLPGEPLGLLAASALPLLFALAKAPVAVPAAAALLLLLALRRARRAG